MPTETTVEKPKQQLGMGSLYGPPALYNINALIDVCPDSVSIDKISDDDIYEALKQLHSKRSSDEWKFAKRDLDGLTSWCQRNMLPLNVGKCSVMSYTRLTRPILFDYQTSKESLKRKQTVMDPAYLISKGHDSILDEPRRILNADETCFLLSPKETKVLAPKGCKNVYKIDRAVSKANLTVMFTFSPSGDTTLPMIIHPYNLNSVPEEWGIGLSENGWMKAEIFFEYISKG
ncbi:hypothetical protein QE152_g37277 [Popillia japonica]|uniref:DDE-1 domain-containing protein n=1 Tax=Popillia japonica TaxID=7064 RepID=A0AAW1IB07_POPJA